MILKSYDNIISTENPWHIVEWDTEFVCKYCDVANIQRS